MWNENSNFLVLQSSEVTDGKDDSLPLFPAIGWPSSNNYDRHRKFSVLAWNNGFHELRDITGYNQSREHFIDDSHNIACIINPNTSWRVSIRWISQIKMCRFCGRMQEQDPPHCFADLRELIRDARRDEDFCGIVCGYDQSVHFSWPLAEAFIDLYQSGHSNMVTGTQCENPKFCRNDLLERIRKHAVEEGMWEYASMREMKEHLRMLKEADRRSVAFAKARESTLRWLRSKPLRKKNLKFLSRLAMSEKLVQTTNHK